MFSARSPHTGTAKLFWLSACLKLTRRRFPGTPFPTSKHQPLQVTKSQLRHLGTSLLILFAFLCHVLLSAILGGPRVPSTSAVLPPATVPVRLLCLLSPGRPDFALEWNLTDSVVAVQCITTNPLTAAIQASPTINNRRRTRILTDTAIRLSRLTNPTDPRPRRTVTMYVAIWSCQRGEDIDM